MQVRQLAPRRKIRGSSCSRGETGKRARRSTSSGTRGCSGCEAGKHEVGRARGSFEFRHRGGAVSGKVWVNTKSGVYHKSGRYYGKTKEGKFMTEAEAKAAGYKAAEKE